MNLLNNKGYAPLLSLFEKEKPDRRRFYFSLLTLRMFQIDSMLLSSPGAALFLTKQCTTPLGSLLFSHLLERIKLAFEFPNLATDSAEKGAFMQGASLIKKNTMKVNKHREYICLSASEITNIFFVEQATARTKFKELWLQHHKRNLRRLANAFSPHMHKHLDDIQGIYTVYKNAAISKLVSMERDACDPRHYHLKNFPPFMVNYLTNSDIVKYKKRLEKMGAIHDSLKTYNTVNLSKGIVIGFISLRLIAREILKTHQQASKRLNDWDLASLISKSLITYINNHPLKHLNHKEICTHQTFKNVTTNDQLLYIEAWAATELGNTIIKFKKKIFDQKGNINKPSLSEAIGVFCVTTLGLPDDKDQSKTTENETQKDETNSNSFSH